MKVKDLIQVLKKMPPDIKIGYAHHDNSEYEVAGWVKAAEHKFRDDFDPDADPSADTRMIAAQPNEWVVLS